jgi:hypothetical protein
MKHFFLMLIVVSSAIISAQPNSNSEIKNGSISGRIFDAELNEPLPYVNIVIKDGANKIIVLNPLDLPHKRLQSADYMEAYTLEQQCILV